MVMTDSRDESYILGSPSIPVKRFTKLGAYLVLLAMGAQGSGDGTVL
jgi:hypothetical protein